MTRNRITIVLVALLAGATATSPISRSWAEEPAPAPPAPAPQPAVTPPVLVTYVEAKYPAEALAAGEGARVELVITIAADGTVTDVQVATPVGGGFDEAAVAAARRFVFEPARQNGTPIPARVKYVYVFTPPAPEVEATPATGRLEGRVLDRAGGAPVIGADVAIEDETGVVLARTETDADGGFGFDDLAPGRYRVRVNAFEYGARAEVETITAGEATSVTYRLDAERPAGTGDDGDGDGEYGATAVVDAPAREVTSRKLRGNELTSVAGTRGDALRSVELLPGVARPPSGAGFLVIRGSAPWDSSVMLEGADVPLLYHFGGLTSFVPSGLLESIDFYPGNFSVKYGRRIGAVIEVGLRDPRKDGMHGTVDLNLLDSSFVVEGPLGRGLSFFVGARRSYMDFWFENVVPAEEIGVSAAPVYWDWQAMLAWNPTARDRVRLTGYGSSDEMAIVVKKPSDRDPAMRGRLAMHTGFQRAALSWRHRYAANVEHDASIVFGTFRFDQELGPLAEQKIPGYALYGRAEWRAGLTSWLRVIGGVDISEEWASVTYHGPRFGQLEGNPGGMDFSHQPMTQVDSDVFFSRPAAYVEASVRPGGGVELIGGVRGDYFGDTDEVAIDPRLVARWTALPQLVVKGGVGRFSQPPNYGDSIEGLGNPELLAVSALHTGVGVEWTPAARASFGVDGFYKDLDDLIVSDGMDSTKNGGDGRVYGLELSARLAPGGRFSGFLSYTLSRGERDDDGDGDGEWRVADMDQTHILSAAGQLKLGGGFTVGGTLRLVSGSPKTPVVGSIYDADRDTYQPVYGAVNSERNPTFHQLDVRVEKRWTWSGGNLAAYLDVQNVYNARHVEGEAWNFDYTQKVSRYGLPILPSVGLRGEL
jgi:TonB family protein